MVKHYSTSRMASVDANLSTRAELLAESGYRFLAAEYFAAADDADRNPGPGRTATARASRPAATRAPSPCP